MRAIDSKTRAAILAAAGQHGWTRTHHATWTDTFERPVPLDESTPFGRIATNFGWSAREQLDVDYTDAGAVNNAHLRTPEHQAALDGKFVDSITVRGQGKKEQVLEWLAAPLWAPKVGV